MWRRPTSTRDLPACVAARHASRDLLTLGDRQLAGCASPRRGSHATGPPHVAPQLLIATSHGSRHTTQRRARTPQLPDLLLLRCRQPESMHHAHPRFGAPNQATRTTVVHRRIETTAFCTTIGGSPPCGAVPCAARATWMHTTKLGRVRRSRPNRRTTSSPACLWPRRGYARIAAFVSSSAAHSPAMADLGVAIVSSVAAGGFALLGAGAGDWRARRREKQSFKTESALELAGMERHVWGDDWVELRAHIERQTARMAVAGVPSESSRRSKTSLRAAGMIAATTSRKRGTRAAPSRPSFWMPGVWSTGLSGPNCLTNPARRRC